MDYHTDIPEIDSVIDARMEILSPTVRHLLNGDAVPTLASALATQYALTEEMQSGIEREISLILMYMEPVDTFATNLMTEYLVPPEVAIEIEREVTAKLFAPLISELGHSSEIVQDSEVPLASMTPEAPVTLPPVPSQPPVVMQTPAPTPAPHVPVARVMPHSQAEAVHDPRTSTELPNALLQNLKASLMHSVPEEPLEGTNPAPSYNAILGPKPTTPPTTPPNMPPNP